MRKSGLAKTCFFSGISLVIGALAATSGVRAQSSAVPPNLGPDPETGWFHLSTQLTPVSGLPGPLHDDPAHPHVNNTTGRQANYEIADLSDPNLTQWAKDIMKKDNDEVLAGKIAYTPQQSCRPAGVPASDVVRGAGAIHFAQTPKEVLIVWPGYNQVRHIYMNVPHSRNPQPSYFGESVGHYEGNTLVVDTIGLNTKTFVDAYRTPHSDKLHVEERWKLAEDGKLLQVTLQVDDPATYVHPWSGTMDFRREQQPLVESVCAENNQHFDFHIPVAEKADF